MVPRQQQEGGAVAAVLMEASVATPVVDSLSPPSDGTFNGFDLFHIDNAPESYVHCIGENFQQNRSWLFRSCEYTNFCFNVDTKQYTIYTDKQPIHLPKDVWSSTQLETENQLVSAGAQPKTWFPRIAEKKYKIKTRIGSFQPTLFYGDIKDRPTSYYRFNATILPFYRHPKSFQNPGHLIWDDFLSLYTLLDVFDRTEDQVMLSQMMRPVTDDFEEQPHLESDLMAKFLGIFGGEHAEYDLQTMEKFALNLKQKNQFLRTAKQKKDDPIVVCAAHAVTGSGTLSDHGESHWHGQSKSDFDRPLNTGRGGVFRRYRHFMMKNMGVDSRAPIQKSPRYKIVVAAGSSRKKGRTDVDFTTQINVLNQEFANRAQIAVHDLASLSAKQQMELASTTAIYVTVVGGGSVTGYFLPKGASVFLYYGSKKLDWDFWNNFPDVNVHWMPLKNRGSKHDLTSLVELVGRHLDYLDHEEP